MMLPSVKITERRTYHAEIIVEGDNGYCSGHLAFGDTPEEAFEKAVTGRSTCSVSRYRVSLVTGRAD